MELADMADLKTAARNSIQVRTLSGAPIKIEDSMKIFFEPPWAIEPLYLSWIIGIDYYEDPCECNGKAYNHIFKGITIHLLFFSITIEREILNGDLP